MADVYDFGLRIKQLREQKGLTQGDLAQKIHVSIQTISGYENNTQMPSLETAVDLCVVLNTSLDSLMNLDKRFVINISHFTPIQRELISRFIKLIEETSSIS